MKAPSHLRTEYLVSPLGVAAPRPRFSWEINDARRGARQTAYEVDVAESLAGLRRGPTLWSSGRVRSDATAQVEYAGHELKSGQRLHWRVRVRDGSGQLTAWSAPACFEMGLLRPSDWIGAWIGAPWHGSLQMSAPCPYLRREFVLSQPVIRATLHATALGLYEIHLNGRVVGDDVLAPGWTDYRVRVPSRSYDVTAYLRRGANAFGAILGDGWYCGRVGLAERQIWGERPWLRAQVHVLHADGTTTVIATSGDWKVCQGPLLYADLLAGEGCDARLENPGWDRPGLEDAGWLPCAELPDPGLAITPSPMPGVRRQEELQPIAPPAPLKGERPTWIFDLGQNMVGWVRLRLRGSAGHTVRLRYGEMLNPDGSLYTANLRSARVTDYYTLKGRGLEVYEPRFTYHGFRYVEVWDLPGPPREDTLRGVVIHSDLAPVGSFSCSHPLVNQLQRNILWGQKGNFLDVPTDCPQRDERLGWTGDAQVFAPTACFNMDAASFYTKWMQDLEDAQAKSGAIPCLAPAHPRYVEMEDGGPAWSDAFAIIPFTMVQQYGDLRILERHYPALRRYLAYLQSKSRRHLLSLPGSPGYRGYGDWLAIGTVDNDPFSAPTPKEVVGTAYFARVAGILSRIARLLGHGADARRYEVLRAAIVRAFCREFVSPAGRVAGHSQTAYLLALGFDLLPRRQRAPALAYLLQDIEARGFHLSTGFVGTPLLAPVLARFGKMETAYRLLLQDTYPSWLFPVKNGATTMWERWNSWTPEGGFGNAGMNSFNHYAYGAVGEWLYAAVAGLGMDETRPGYRRFLIHPRPGRPDANPPAGLREARAELKTISGTARCSWRIRSQRFELDLELPPNTSGEVRVPASAAASVREGGKPARASAGLRFLRMEDGTAVFDAVAGRYRFSAPWPPSPEP